MKTPQPKKPAAKATPAKAKAKDGRAKNGGARPGSGKPPFVPTASERKQVETLSGLGVPVLQIATLVREGIAADTLLKHFRVELDRGKAKANAKVAQTLFQKATSGDTTAAIWWSKTQMKWSERVEVTGLDGGALEHKHEFRTSGEFEEALGRALAKI